MCVRTSETEILSVSSFSPAWRGQQSGRYGSLWIGKMGGIRKAIERMECLNLCNILTRTAYVFITSNNHGRSIGPIKIQCCSGISLPSPNQTTFERTNGIIIYPLFAYMILLARHRQTRGIM